MFSKATGSCYAFRLAVVHDIFTKNGVKVTEELAREYCHKVTDLLRISFDKGMESQKQIDDIILQKLLNIFPNKESKK